MKLRRLLASALAVAAACMFSAASVFAAGAEPDQVGTPSEEITEGDPDVLSDIEDAADIDDSSLDEPSDSDEVIDADASPVEELPTEDGSDHESLAANAMVAPAAAANDLLAGSPEADLDTQSETAVQYTLETASYENRIIGAFESGQVPIQPIALQVGALLANGSPVTGAVKHEWTDLMLNPNAASGQSSKETGPLQLVGSEPRTYGTYVFGHQTKFTADATRSDTEYYRVRATMDGDANAKAEKKFKIRVTGDLVPFALEAQQKEALEQNDVQSRGWLNAQLTASPERPVTLVADIDPDNTEDVRSSLWGSGSGANVSFAQCRWMVLDNEFKEAPSEAISSGPFEETKVDGKPALTLKGSIGGGTSVFYCVIDYVYSNGSETGLIEYHSKPVAVELSNVSDVSLLPDGPKDPWHEWGLMPGEMGKDLSNNKFAAQNPSPSNPDTPPGTDDPSPSKTPEPSESDNPDPAGPDNPGPSVPSTPPAATAEVAVCSYFAMPPLSQEECVTLYKELLGPYRDTSVKNKPFALQAPQLSADGSALSDASQKELLGLINFIRRCAGVGSVSLDAQKSVYAQAAAQYNSVHGTLGHYGAQNDMSPEGRAANTGLTNSNVSYGSVSGGKFDFIEMQRNQFREDNGTNWPGLGHRRWLLDNRTQTMGFGYATGSGHGEHLATYIKGPWNDGFAITGASPGLEAFPGYGAFPVELMDCKAWSLTLGNGWKVPDYGVTMKVVRDEGTANEYVVELNRVSRSAAWSSKGDIFTADSLQSGSGPILTFSPGSMYPSGNVWNGNDLAGHTYTIHISGLRQRSGLPAPDVKYSTQFFSLTNALSGYTPPVNNSSTAPTPTQNPIPTPTPTLNQTQRPTQVPTETPVPTSAPIETQVPTPVLIETPIPIPVPTQPQVAAPGSQVPPAATQAPAATAAPAASPASASAAQSVQPTKAPAPVLSTTSSANHKPETASGDSTVLVSVLGTQIAVAKPQQNNAPTTVGDILRSLSADGGTLEVRMPSGHFADNNAPAATGMMVYAYDDEGTLRDIYPIVVPFDVLGTGTMNLTQLTRLARGYTGTEPLHGIYLDAAAQTRPGVVTLSDLVKAAHLLVQAKRLEG